MTKASKNKKFHVRKAFTLIELLIVIAIIGTLASIVLVSTNSSRDKAKMAKALMSMRSLSTMANACTISSGTLNLPVSNGNPGTTVCNNAPETLPDIANTSFTYCAQGCGGWYSGTDGSYAISAYSDFFPGGRKVIVCGSGVDVTG
ncbi:MAG: hypothetical protein ACD_5C00127G0004 [uncultured bacterium]|nr:MAG: hypothetical protein ACD_5C00127G0004 [uncultured bacterium]